MLPRTGACAPGPDPHDCGPPVDACDLCIGPPCGCRLAADGVLWCGGQRGHVPGYRVVGQRDGLTGYRRRKADGPIDPATAARVEAFLAEHTARCQAEREDKARAADVVRAGLSALPADEKAAQLEDALDSSRVIAELRRDISDLAAIVAERAA
jgi:hypothetical protein